MRDTAAFNSGATRLGTIAHDRQVGGFDQLWRSVCHSHASHIGVRLCLRAPSLIASATSWVVPNMLSYTMVIFIAAPPRPLCINRQQRM
jgi:hypothetical protein